MLVGAIIGGVGGVITGLILKRGRQVLAATAPAENKIQFQSTPMIPKQVELNQSPEKVVHVLGQPEKTVDPGAKVIYVA
jgi:hypothetical protein